MSLLESRCVEEYGRLLRNCGCSYELELEPAVLRGFICNRNQPFQQMGQAPSLFWSQAVRWSNADAQAFDMKQTTANAFATPSACDQARVAQRVASDMNARQLHVSRTHHTVVDV